MLPSTSTVAIALSALAISLSGYVLSRPAPVANVTPSAVRQALMSDPRILTDVVGSMREREEAAQRQASVSAVAAIGDDLWTVRDQVLGNPEATRTVVEFYDYQCQYCRAAKDEIDAFLRSERDVRVVLRPLPILGAISLYAAKASLAAAQQGRWQAMHDGLMTRAMPLTEASVNAVAAEAGLDLARMRRDMESDEVRRAIDESVDVARRLRMDGTPGFVAQGVGVMMGYGNRERFAAFARQAAGRRDVSAPVLSR